MTPPQLHSPVASASAEVPWGRANVSRETWTLDFSLHALLNPVPDAEVRDALATMEHSLHTSPTPTLTSLTPVGEVVPNSCPIPANETVPSHIPTPLQMMERDPHTFPIHTLVSMTPVGDAVSHYGPPSAGEAVPSYICAPLQMSGGVQRDCSPTPMNNDVTDQFETSPTQPFRGRLARSTFPARVMTPPQLHSPMASDSAEVPRGRANVSRPPRPTARITMPARQWRGCSVPGVRLQAGPSAQLSTNRDGLPPPLIPQIHTRQQSQCDCLPDTHVLIVQMQDGGEPDEQFAPPAAHQQLAAPPLLQYEEQPGANAVPPQIQPPELPMQPNVLLHHRQDMLNNNNQHIENRLVHTLRMVGDRIDQMEHVAYDPPYPAVPAAADDCSDMAFQQAYLASARQPGQNDALQAAQQPVAPMHRRPHTFEGIPPVADSATATASPYFMAQQQQIRDNPRVVPTAPNQMFEHVWHNGVWVQQLPSVPPTFGAAPAYIPPEWQPPRSASQPLPPQMRQNEQPQPPPRPQSYPTYTPAPPPPPVNPYVTTRAHMPRMVGAGQRTKAHKLASKLQRWQLYNPTGGTEWRAWAHDMQLLCNDAGIVDSEAQVYFLSLALTADARTSYRAIQPQHRTNFQTVVDLMAAVMNRKQQPQHLIVNMASGLLADEDWTQYIQRRKSNVYQMCAQRPGMDAEQIYTTMDMMSCMEKDEMEALLRKDMLLADPQQAAVKLDKLRLDREFVRTIYPTQHIHQTPQPRPPPPSGGALGGCGGLTAAQATRGGYLGARGGRPSVPNPPTSQSSRCEYCTVDNHAFADCMRYGASAGAYPRSEKWIQDHPGDHVAQDWREMAELWNAWRTMPPGSGRGPQPGNRMEGQIATHIYPDAPFQFMFDIMLARRADHSTSNELDEAALCMVVQPGEDPPTTSQATHTADPVSTCDAAADSTAPCNGSRYGLPYVQWEHLPHVERDRRTRARARFD